MRVAVRAAVRVSRKAGVRSARPAACCTPAVSQSAPVAAQRPFAGVTRPVDGGIACGAGRFSTWRVHSLGMGWHEAAACGGRLAKKKGKKGGGAGGAGGGKGGSAAADLEGLEPEELLQALLADVRESMDRKVAGLKSELTKLRGSGASPNMLDHVVVDAYGTPTELSAIAQVAARGATMLQVNVFDPSLAQAVADAIAADEAHQLNPSVDGMVVKVPIPKTTKETKAAVVKVAGQATEKTKNALRSVRKQGLDQLKKLKGSVSDDDLFRYQKQVQDVTDEMTDAAVKLHDDKVKELA